MFQRQLSTNALSTGPAPIAQSAAPISAQSTLSSTATTTSKPSSRSFQRQMTTSQLFGSGAGGGQSSATSSAVSGLQDKKRLLANLRADLNLASSTACLTTALNQATGRPSSARQDSLADGAQSIASASSGKKVPKNKRIISRMLSISAIHTTVGTGTSSYSSSNDSAGGNLSPLYQQQQQHHQALTSGYQSDEAGQSIHGSTVGSEQQQQQQQQRSDKFDSSFRRSRSSSTSSTTATQQQLAESQSLQGGRESILCIAFVDPAQTGGFGSFAASGAHQGAASSLSCSQAQSGGGGGGGNVSGSSASGPSSAIGSGGGGSVPTSQVQSPAAGPNHKSLSQIDGSQQAGQLALWLGTSTGSVLLVGLQMPDNEDNRVLQLQSINAEAIPQASIKLSGQILCLATFTCEARLQYGSSTILAYTPGGSGTQSASQSSSLEGDTLMQSPSSSGSSGSASGGASAPSGQAGGSSSSAGSSGLGGVGGIGGPGGVTSSGSRVAYDSLASVSFDTRSSLFFAVVSEKRACVYQVPANCYSSPASGVPSLSSGGKSSSSSAEHSHQHHHGHQQSSSSPTSTSSMALGDSPMASFLANKRNLIAECELSETSYSCRSAIVQMRTPDESCLVSYLATGNIVVHSLPRLRPILMDADFAPYSSARISSSMCLARNGHCLYQPSAGEISKFTISAQYKALVGDMIGLVYVPREMPEMPRTNFFKSLFSVSQSVRQSDRDELFGECSAGKPSRGVAKHFSSGPGAGSGGGGGGQLSGMDKLKGAAAGTMGHELRMAREGLDERGEKLSEIEDRTLNMMNSAETYSQAAHQLAQKFKDKKWYQF